MHRVESSLSQYCTEGKKISQKRYSEEKNTI